MSELSFGEGPIRSEIVPPSIRYSAPVESSGAIRDEERDQLGDLLRSVGAAEGMPPTSPQALPQRSPSRRHRVARRGQDEPGAPPWFVKPGRNRVHPDALGPTSFDSALLYVASAAFGGGITRVASCMRQPPCVEVTWMTTRSPA